jgi:DNA primase
VRERGPEALTQAVRAARGILEHLIEDTLDETFVRGDAHERAARVREVVKLITSEDDPTVRAMAQTYADGIAQRIGLPDAASFRLLKDAVTRSLAEASRDGAPRGQGGTPPEEGREAQNVAHTHDAGVPGHSRPTTDISPWRARSRDQRDEIGLSILGCFLDFPDLIDDPGSEEAVRELEGDTALAVAILSSSTSTSAPPVTSSPTSPPASSQKAGQKIGQDVLEILAHVPASIHTFAAQRLSSPRHEHREEARLELMSNAQKLKRLGLSRQKAQVVEALHRIERTGDRAAEDALLREMDRRAREKHGL